MKNVLHFTVIKLNGRLFTFVCLCCHDLDCARAVCTISPRRFKKYAKIMDSFHSKITDKSTNTCILIINIQSLVHNESYPKHIIT